MGAGYRFLAKAQEKAAEVFIYEDVGADWFGGVTASQVKDDLKKAGAVDRIDVHIASYGGDMNEGLAIYRMLADHKARVVTHVDGVAASIASVIAMAGEDIIIAEAGSMMIHEGWTIAAGNAKKLRAVADQADAMTSQMADLYAARTKNSVAKVKDWMAAETWFYGQEAVDAGFATSVAPNVRMAASARSLWHATMNSRIAQRINLSREDAPKAPHPANDDVRAQLTKLSERARARHLSTVN